MLLLLLISVPSYFTQYMFRFGHGDDKDIYPFEPDCPTPNVHTNGTVAPVLRDDDSGRVPVKITWSITGTPLGFDNRLEWNDAICIILWHGQSRSAVQCQIIQCTEKYNRTRFLLCVEVFLNRYHPASPISIVCTSHLVKFYSHDGRAEVNKKLCCVKWDVYRNSDVHSRPPNYYYPLSPL